MNITKRKDIKSLKKVLIVGETKHGKSTFAEKYCKNNGLNAVVCDFENTNFTDMDLLVDFDLTNDRKLFRTLHKLIKEVEASDYDTIVLDGIDSVIEGFISDANGLKAYADRSKTFARLMNDLDNSHLNVIFISQLPGYLDYYKDSEEKPNKCVVRLNARVNETYLCFKDNNSKFEVKTVNKREVIL